MCMCGLCLFWAVHFYKLVIDLILLAHLGCLSDWLVSASWPAEHYGCTRRSRRSCSRSTHTAWPEPPSRSCDVCPDSFHLRLVDCRVSCCRFAPGQVWCPNHILGCAFCLVSDTVPPSFVSLFHKNVSTRSTLW